MGRLIVLQFAMLAGSVAVSAGIWGTEAWLSALAGGLCYLIPTALAVLLLVSLRRQPELLSVALTAAEFGKVFVVCLMMLLVFVLYRTVSWPAFLVGLVSVSQAGLFTYQNKRRVRP